MKDRVMKIMSLASGLPSAEDGEYIVHYDPGVVLVTTPNLHEATRFDAVEAMELWKGIDPLQPTRPDGKPNRPLTAWSVQIVRA